MSDFIIKQNDTSPAIEYQLQDDDRTAIDISDYTEVSFHMEEAGAETTVIDDDTVGNVRVTDAANGIVKYAWQSMDTESAGFYEAEWEVEYSNGAIETFPNGGNIIIQIMQDIA